MNSEKTKFVFAGWRAVLTVIAILGFVSFGYADCVNVTKVPSVSITSIINDLPQVCGAPTTGSCVTVKWTATGFPAITTANKGLGFRIIVKVIGTTIVKAVTAAASATTISVPVDFAQLQGSVDVTVERDYAACAKVQKQQSFIIL